MNRNKINYGKFNIIVLLLTGFFLFSPLLAVGQNSTAQLFDRPGETSQELEIHKAVDSVRAAPGSILTYSIQVKNPGDTSV